MSFNKMKIHLNNRVWASFILLLGGGLLSALTASAQDTLHLSLAQVIRQGLDSSKTLHISTAKVDEAISHWQQTKDAAFPDIKASFTGSEAFILTRTLQIKGLMREPMQLPADNTLYLGNLGINEAIFAGNQMRYARQSADLLHRIAVLNVENDSEDVKADLIESYINLYKIDENQKILVQELQDIQGRLDEVIQFKDHGLATDNDVLRFKLQKAKAELTQIDLDNNRIVANYALCILLGLPEGTYIQVDSTLYNPSGIPSLPELIDKAITERKEIGIDNYQNDLSLINIKKVKDERLPTLGAGITGYYINPNSQFFPPENSFLVPVTVGLNLSWHISTLYTSRHKIAAAKIQHRELQIARDETVDKIKVEVNKQYYEYLQSLKKVDVLQTAVAQAKENDRIMELKYQNQLATTTDRIDAQTMLYQSLVNLSIAQAEITTAYYQLLRATGALNATSVL